MQEEFHADLVNGAWVYKRLYGWDTLNANIWLPSLSELVGIDPNAYRDWSGTYFSAMQGLNASTSYWTDSKGGTQFAYFKQYNASGGGQKIWEICGKKEAWFRSPHCGSSQGVWSIKDESSMNSSANPPTLSRAVHPAVLLQAPFLLAYLKKTRGKLTHCAVLPLHKKARKAHLFSCKRLLDGSHLLPPFCGEGRSGSKLIFLFIFLLAFNFVVSLFPNTLLIVNVVTVRS